jgi:anaerobic ribonucleoside-triphosphate reductase activating protein
MLAFHGGQAVSLDIVVAQLGRTRDELAVEGVSLLGGEPIAHADGAAALARSAHELGLGVMVFSGYTLAEIRQFADRAVVELLALTDLLVDGPYVRELPEPRRRWIGSSNQQVHFLTDRYSPDDPCWLRPNTLEIRLRGNELHFNGFPGRQAVGFWKR